MTQVVNEPGKQALGDGSGALIPIASSDSTNPTIVHAEITNTRSIDHVHLKLWNSSGADVSVSLVWNPADGTAPTADEITVDTIPAGSFGWVLQATPFRRRGANGYTLAAFVAAGDVGKINASGWFVRTLQLAITV